MNYAIAMSLPWREVRDVGEGEDIQEWAWGGGGMGWEEGGFQKPFLVIYPILPTP